VLPALDNIICADPEGFVARGYMKHVVALYKFGLHEYIDEYLSNFVAQLLEAAIQNSL
jgi:hypothetical protein